MPSKTRNAPQITITDLQVLSFMNFDPLLDANEITLNHERSANQWPIEKAKRPIIPASASPLNMNARPIVPHHIKKQGFEMLVITPLRKDPYF